MSLIFHKSSTPPTEKARGDEGTHVLYGKNKDGTLVKMPPIWTLRGYFETHHFDVMSETYDRGYFREPKNDQEHERYMAEFGRAYQPFAQGVLGIRQEVDNCVMFTYIASHPLHDKQGYVSRYLNVLGRKQTIIFPEVLPWSKLVDMLKRRSFKLWWVADSDDELGIFFPCYVREAR